MKPTWGDRLDAWFDQLKPMPAATMLMLAGCAFLLALSLGLREKPVVPPVTVTVNQLGGR